MIKNNLKTYCQDNMKTSDLLVACLFFNGNPKYPKNLPADLCFAEARYKEYLYPYLNKNYCLGYKTSAM